MGDIHVNVGICVDSGCWLSHSKLGVVAVVVIMTGNN